jgi:hypothetical protein
MRAITVNEPNQRFVRLYITAAEREADEAERIRRAGGPLYVAAVFAGAGLMLAFVYCGFLLAGVL